MARAFVRTSSQYLENTSTPPVVAVPLTLACWFYATEGANFKALFSIADSAADTDFFQLGLPTTEQVQARTNSAAANEGQNTTATFALNTWNHGAAVFASATSRTPYLNGTAGGTGTVSVTPASLDRMGIGVRNTLTRANFMDGRIADMAIWNIALTADDVAMLAKGASPLSVRPDALVAWWPLVGRDDPEPDFVGGFDAVLAATPTQGDHPRLNRLWKQVSRPTKITTIPVSLTAGATGTAARALAVGKIAIVSGLVASSVVNAIGLGLAAVSTATAASFLGAGVITKMISVAVTATPTTLLSVAKAFTASVVVTPVQSLLLTLRKFMGYGGIAIAGAKRWRDRKPGWAARDAKWTKRR